MDSDEKEPPRNSNQVDLVECHFLSLSKEQNKLCIFRKQWIWIMFNVAKNQGVQQWCHGGGTGCFQELFNGSTSISIPLMF